MSRISDTRELTRSAATRLVAAGRQAHELTVDLIYAEIKQGSRTTINDELKLWKDKQTKLDALTAGLPADVANAMVAIWAMAVEHGEKVFDERRAEIELQFEQATTQLDALGKEKSELASQIEILQSKIMHCESTVNLTREDLASERTAKDAAVAKSDNLVQQLEATKAEATQAIQMLKTEHQRRVDEMQAAHTEQERVFRQELDKTTERLEIAQRHMLVQVDEARQAQKRVESFLVKAEEKNGQLSTELNLTVQQVSLLKHTLERAQQDLSRSQEDMSKLRNERELLLQQVASSTGQLGAMGEQIAALERRAAGAEERLEESLKKSVTNPRF